MGSANFTQAAMGSLRQGNIEAMLHYALPASTKALHAMALLKDGPWANDDESTDDGPCISPYLTFASYDWQTKTFRCILQCNKDDFENITSAYFDQQNLTFTAQQDDYVAQLTITLPNPVYSFSLNFTDKDKDTPQSSLQLVTQLNAQDDQLGYLPKPDLNTILAQLRRLDTQRNPGSGGGFNVESASSNDDPADEIGDVFDFFSMFQAFYKLKEYFAKHPEVNPFISSSANSLALLYRAVDLAYDIGQTKDQHIIKQFILLSELQVTANSLKAQYPGEDTDKLLNDINQSLSRLTPAFQDLISSSPLLKQYLDIDEKTDTVSKKIMQTIFDWFKTQLSECK
jgi:hypothetical protein